jgi:hypothetical protein
MKSVKDLKGYPFKDPFDGDFRCHNKQLTSLEGCTKVVKGYFSCSGNKLQSLQYCPEVVKGDFLCSGNNLESLQYCPPIINGYFRCGDNKLQSLQYCPQIVEGDFSCSYNNLQSLQNIHKYCKQIGGTLWAFNNPIKSHVLGVMLIENIKQVNLSLREEVLRTINIHLETDRDVFICQDNLIKAGFAEYAQL